MLEIFAYAFKLRNTYKTNTIIWSLKSLPLIKKLLPDSLYANHGLKVFANIISIILEVLSIYMGKLLYLLAVWGITSTMTTARSDSFAHILLFLTLIGGFLNTRIFTPSKDKFYAIFLMRIDAREYTITDYFYFISKMFLGTVVFSLLFGLLCGASIITCLVIPVYVVCIKFLFTAIGLNNCKKENRDSFLNKISPAKWVAILLLLGAAALPYLDIVLGETALWYATLVLIIPAIFSLRYIIRFDSYRSVYKELLNPESMMLNTGTNAVGAAQQLAMQSRISKDVSQTSNKSGYKYFNELFIKRHSKLLTRSAKRITALAAVCIAAVVVVASIFPDSKSDINHIMMNYLPYFLFLMYLINGGRKITQAMFMNCDHSMLTYRFYRQPKALLSLFVDRLKYIILINLMPASVIAAGLPLILYITGGTPQPLNYLVLFVSIIAMSVFFSVHSMVLYYLLQPYNVNLENKGMAFSIINGVTYILCYGAIQVKLPTLWFGSAISAFCIIYAVVAVILAYRLAPKTFKLRN